jgi:hypothetical protein
LMEPGIGEMVVGILRVYDTRWGRGRER